MIERFINVANNQFYSDTWEVHKHYPSLLICEEGEVFDTVSMKVCKKSYNKRYEDGGYCFISTPKMINVHELVGMHYLPEKENPTDVYNHIDEDKRNNAKTNIEIVPKRVNNVNGTIKNVMLTYDEYMRVMNHYSFGECSQNSLREYVKAYFNKDTDDTLYTRLVKGETYKTFYGKLQEEEPEIVERIVSIQKLRGRKGN